jgi:hypothetical protein
LCGRFLFFVGKTHYGAFLGIFQGGRDWVKKVKAPSKNPKKCPIMCFAPDKNNITHFQRYTGIFMSPYMQERETGGGRERESKREGERESERKSE